MTLRGEEIGYLWAPATEESGGSAHYERRLGAAGDSFDAAVIWATRMGEESKAGRSPMEALHRWVGTPEDPLAGGIAEDAADRFATSYEALTEMANPGLADPREIMEWPASPPMDAPSRDSASLEYPFTTEEAVCYLPVVREASGDIVIGYLWAAVSDDAAGYYSTSEAGEAGPAAYLMWKSRLRQARCDGYSPMCALRYWIGMPEDPAAGKIPADAVERRASGLAELERLAGMR
ncbi:hypothetical protein [Nonomuraea cavernae]|uniref:hypothetical protein n=1 Tax=Nonomuraea cavernae TaxID=2045107 RepID=UPI00166E784B|nr:hypothetical protein [Nonomuraea cavernae]MCA2189526.1 hypothetical protein [Nonomuraea cavernae]